ncbi:unnamed protein product, partial [Polarella glacialis]
MTRHSKHSNDRTFFTAKERKDAGFAGTRKDVLGTDAMLPFGFCALSLKAPRDPVATPEGHVFDREVIMKYLLEQKLELQAHQKKFDEQERRKDRKVQAANQKGDMKELEDFLQADQGLLSQDARHKRALENAGSDPRTCKKVRGDELLARDGEFKNQMRKECFWAKENAHSAAPTELKKMDLATKCPMTGKKLKLKDLIPIKFEVADQKLVDQGGGRGMYCCAVSKDPIIFQQVRVMALLFLHPPLPRKSPVAEPVRPLSELAFMSSAFAVLIDDICPRQATLDFTVDLVTVTADLPVFLLEQEQMQTLSGIVATRLPQRAEALTGFADSSEAGSPAAHGLAGDAGAEAKSEPTTAGAFAAIFCSHTAATSAITSCCSCSLCGRRFLATTARSSLSAQGASQHRRCSGGGVREQGLWSSRICGCCGRGYTSSGCSASVTAALFCSPTLAAESPRHGNHPGTRLRRLRRLRRRVWQRQRLGLWPAFEEAGLGATRSSAAPGLLFLNVAGEAAMEGFSADAWGVAASPRRLEVLRRQLAAVRGEVASLRSAMQEDAEACKELARLTEANRRRVRQLTEDEARAASATAEEAAEGTFASWDVTLGDSLESAAGLKQAREQRVEELRSAKEEELAELYLQTESLAEEISVQAVQQIDRCKALRLLRTSARAARLRRSARVAVEARRRLGEECQAKARELSDATEAAAALRQRALDLKQEVAAAGAEAAAASAKGLVQAVPEELMAALQSELYAEAAISASQQRTADGSSKSIAWSIASCGSSSVALIQAQGGKELVDILEIQAEGRNISPTPKLPSSSIEIAVGCPARCHREIASVPPLLRRSSCEGSGRAASGKAAATIPALAAVGVAAVGVAAGCRVRRRRTELRAGDNRTPSASDDLFAASLNKEVSRLNSGKQREA